MIVNTDLFRESALKFLKDGYYSDTIPETKDWYDFWIEEKRRCLEGYEVGGVRITGYHYFYLNYCRMDLVKDSKNRASAEKIESFPAFWDWDYNYFWAVEIARYGISKEEYDALNLDINIKESDLVGGKHLVVLKARGKGYSYKSGAMLARNFHLKRKSKNYALAEQAEYLTKDGILNKAWDNIAFINDHTPWTQPTLKDTEMYKRTGYHKVQNGVEIEKGTKNTIMGVTLRNDPDKARGKRGELIFFEEAGKCPGLLKAWEVARPSVEQGAVTTGIMIAFGTGGTDEAEYEGLEELFYYPEPNNCIAIENQWDEGASGTYGGFFVPTYKNWQGFMDEDGNSDDEGAIEYHDDQRELKKKSKDNRALDQYICENPYTPQEATLQVSQNLFPVVELAMQKNKVITHGLNNMLSVGDLLYNAEGKLSFRPNSDKSPIFDFPLRKKSDPAGAIWMLEPPVKVDGSPPKGLYYIGHDPYAQDGESIGGSLGVAWVLKQSNNFSPTYHECIVAGYVGRPNTQDEYNENLFKLAEYYGAKIGFENDRGEVIPYAKRFKKLQYLEEEFQMLDKKELQSANTRRPYGMHMTAPRKLQGEVYIRDWLNTVITRYDDGSVQKVLHTIYDPALLEELIKYNQNGNFDRVMALMIAMYHQKELSNSRVVPRKRNPHMEFFNRQLFA